MVGGGVMVQSQNRFKPNFYKIVTIRHQPKLNFYHKEPHINLINIKDNNNNKININNDNNDNNSNNSNNNNNKITSKQLGCDLILISLVVWVFFGWEKLIIFMVGKYF